MENKIIIHESEQNARQFDIDSTKMSIPIVMVSDSNYIFQTKVAVWSMRKSTCRDVCLNITILCSDNLDRDDRDRLLKLESVLPNLKINFYEIESSIFANAKAANHIPVTSFYRLIIPQVLQKEHKCLFLDGDIIVDTDLRNLYLEELEDAYIAGVRDNEFLYNPESAIAHFNIYGFKNFKNYVNAGVLVLNLVKLRRDCLQTQFLKSMEIFYPYMDQDILNKVCGEKVKLLDLKYNYFNRRKDTKVKANKNIEKSSENDKEWEILHFTSSSKPWRNLRIRNADKWWTLAKEALDEEEYNKIYSQAEKMTIQTDWSYLLKRCLGEKVIIIVGYSDIGIDVCVSLRRCKVIAEIYFCDNSKEKRSLSDKNIMIYPVEELAKKYPKALWINVSQSHFKEINGQIKELGILEGQIYVYKNKGKEYFEIIDDDYIEYEMNEMKLKSMGSLNEGKR